MWSRLQPVVESSGKPSDAQTDVSEFRRLHRSFSFHVSRERDLRTACGRSLEQPERGLRDDADEDGLAGEWRRRFQQAWPEHRQTRHECKGAFAPDPPGFVQLSDPPRASPRAPRRGVQARRRGVPASASARRARTALDALLDANACTLTAHRRSLACAFASAARQRDSSARVASERSEPARRRSLALGSRSPRRSYGA